MNKKRIIIMLITVILVILEIGLMQVTYCMDAASLTPNANVETGNLKVYGNKIIGIVRAVGSILSIAVLAILGIKYMTSSPEGKADYKGAMMPYIVGALLLFGTTWIASGVYDVVTSLKAP